MAGGNRGANGCARAAAVRSWAEARREVLSSRGMQPLSARSLRRAEPLWFQIRQILLGGQSGNRGLSEVAYVPGDDEFATR